jgi:probable HAF family extracellular repeat protein
MMLLGISPATGQVPVPPTYHVTALDGLPGESSAVAKGMNEAGQIVGWSGSPPRAFLWTDGAMVELAPVTGDEAALGEAINGTAQVAGQSGPAFSAATHAVRWVGGLPQDLGTLGGGSATDSSTGRDINDLGHVVGDSSIGGKTHAFLFTDQGGMVDLTPTYDDGHGYAINEAGQVAGYANYRAFRWQAGQLEDLGIPETFAFSFGFDINELGQVVGAATSATGASQRLIRWTDTVGWEILGGVGNNNVAWAINDEGVVVGEGVPVGGPVTGVVFFDDLGLFDLDELVAESEWNILRAFDINNAGQIAALAHNSITGQTTAVRLDPMDGGSEPPALHVGGISISFRVRSTTGSATSIVQILDEAGKAVPGASVTAEWLLNGNVASPSRLAVTGANGTAKFALRLPALASGDVVTFCITDIDHSSFVYDPQLNVETCDEVIVP